MVDPPSTSSSTKTANPRSRHVVHAMSYGPDQRVLAAAIVYVCARVVVTGGRVRATEDTTTVDREGRATSGNPVDREVVEEPPTGRHRPSRPCRQNEPAQPQPSPYESKPLKSSSSRWVVGGPTLSPLQRSRLQPPWSLRGSPPSTILRRRTMPFVPRERDVVRRGRCSCRRRLSQPDRSCPRSGRCSQAQSRRCTSRRRRSRPSRSCLLPSPCNHSTHPPLTETVVESLATSVIVKSSTSTVPFPSVRHTMPNRPTPSRRWPASNPVSV